MKKYARILIPVVFLLLLSIFSGCGNSEYGKIKSTLDASLKVLEKLDMADEADLSAQGSAGAGLPWQTGQSGQHKMHADKAGEIYGVKSLINQRQQEIVKAGEAFNANAEQINFAIKRLNEKGIVLTAEEETAVNNYIEEIKEINSNLRLTIGKVYLKMKKLRNNYNDENAGNILDIHAAVDAQLKVREKNLQRLNEISTELKNFLFSKG